MNDRLLRLAERRRVLVARAAAQRLEVASLVEIWRRPLALADKGLAALNFIKRSQPVLLAGSVLLPAAMQPGRVSTWLRRGAAAWRMVRSLRSGHVVS